MREIIVATTSILKISAVEQAFAQMIPDEKFNVQGIKTESGVADQPSTEKETMQGAFNRASSASKKVPNADFWVGIESGVQEYGEQLGEVCWAVIISSALTSQGRSGTFILPNKITELIKSGHDLAEADSIVFGRDDGRSSNGTIGLLSHDVVTRTDKVQHAVVMALIPQINPDLY